MSQKYPDDYKIEMFRSANPGLGRRQSDRVPDRFIHLEKAPDLVAWWKVIRKRQRVLLSIFVTFFGIVLIGSLHQKPIYRSKALLEIEKENPSLVTPGELFQIDTVSDAYLETQYKVLASERLSERVANRLRLDRVEEFIPRKSFWPADIVSANQPVTSPMLTKDGVAEIDPSIRETVLRRFSNRLEIKPVRRSHVVEITFDSENPELAASIVNTLASTYIEKNFEDRWDGFKVQQVILFLGWGLACSPLSCKSGSIKTLPPPQMSVSSYGYPSWPSFRRLNASRAFAPRAPKKRGVSLFD